MSLQFIGDAGVFFPERDAVKFTGIVEDSVIDCYVLRSALEVIGCRPSDTALQIAAKFTARRLDCELAAMIKFKSYTAKVVALEIDAADLAHVERFARSLAAATNGYGGFSRTFATSSPIGLTF